MSAYKAITIVGVILCVLVTRTKATSTSSTLNVYRVNNFVSLTCTDDVNVGPVNATFFYLDSESGPKSLGPPTKYHNFTLDKNNEGRYTCKTISNGALNSTSKPLIRKYHD